MGVFKVLGLQLCLLAFSLGAEARFEWSASDTKDTDEEPNSMFNPPDLETGQEAEAPEFGLEVKHQDPQDFDIMLMTHRVRRSEKKQQRRNREKSRAERNLPGARSALGSTGPLDEKQAPEAHRVRRSKKKQQRRKPFSGARSVLGSAGPLDVKQAPEVVRAKRQLNESSKGSVLKKQLGYRPGKYSPVGRESLSSPVPTKSLD